MDIRPLYDRVIIKRLDAESVSSGGFILPENAQEKPMQATVVAVGAGKRNDNGDLIPLDVKVGDKVLFPKWSGTEFKINGEDLLIVTESDLLAILEG